MENKRYAVNIILDNGKQFDTIVDVDSAIGLQDAYDAKYDNPGIFRLGNIRNENSKVLSIDIGHVAFVFMDPIEDMGMAQHG